MLRLNNVTKVFNAGTVNEKTALQNVSLTVNDGDFVTIIGSNGAGKSTLFNCICGSFLEDEGNIYLDERDITNVPDYKRSMDIGRLFQDPMRGTAPNMTIEENLALAYLRASKKKSVFSRIPIPLGPRIMPANRAPTTCGMWIFSVTKPNSFVDSKIIANPSR